MIRVIVCLSVLLTAGIAQAAVIQHLDATVSGSIITDGAGEVTNWDDQSLAGNNATHAVGSVYYPSTNLSSTGLAGLDFGTDRNSLELFDAAESDSWLDQSAGTGGFTVLVAFMADSLISDWNDLIGNSSSVSSGFGMRFSNSGGMQAYLNGPIDIGGAVVAAGNTIVYAFRYNASTGAYEFWDSKNGISVTGTRAAADFSLSTAVTLGTTQNAQRYFVGMIGEVVVYDTALSDTEFQAERVAMVKKWMLPNTVPPRDLVAKPYDKQVSLNWEDNLEPHQGYNIYRALVPGGRYFQIATKHANSYYTDINLNNNITYYYVVTAVDQAGLDSENSNEASATPLTTVKVVGGDLDYGAYYGYQAWHLAPDEGVFKKWEGWFEADTSPTAANIHGDNWPDMSEYPNEDLFNTEMYYQNGEKAKAYSCSRYSTIDLHVKWMKDYGLKGHFYQVQCANITNSGILGRADVITEYVRTASEKYEVKFCMMPCNNAKTDADNENIVSKIINYWKHCVDDLKITESSQYMYQNGLPVIGFFGFGLLNRPMSVTEATEILDFFQNSPEQKYRVYVMGGVHVGWRTNPKPGGWEPVFLRLDMIAPWRTIHNFTDQTPIVRMYEDLDYCNDNRMDYNPIVSPGGSAMHLPGDLRNIDPRNGGKFFWDQVYEVCKMGSKFMFVAMFDEIDEGTAMYKMAETENDIPIGSNQVTLDEDGYDLPSDWYLRLGGSAQDMLDHSIPLTAHIPIKPHGANLVLHWGFDEGVDLTTEDLSSYHNTGSLGNSIFWTTNGKVGRAILCDGTNDQVTGSAVERWNNEFTVSAWVKHNSLTGIQRYITVQSEEIRYITAERKSISIYQNEGALEMSIDTSAGNKTITAGGMMLMDQWQFVTGTWDGNKAKLYSDGSEVARSSMPGTLMYKNIAEVLASSPDEAMDGYLDEVKIHNYALSDSAVQSLYLTDIRTATEQMPCAVTDFNCDGIVCLGDLILLGDHWGLQERDIRWREMYDLNGDGVIGMGDLILLGRDWNCTLKAAKALPLNTDITMTMNTQYDPRSSEYSPSINVTNIDDITGIGLTVAYDAESLDYIENSLRGLGGITFIKEVQPGLLEINAYTGNGDFEGTIGLEFTSKNNDNVHFEIIDAEVILDKERYVVSNLPNMSYGTTPVVFSLSQNHPNPFNPTTTIEYNLPSDGHASLTVYNVSGQVVSVLNDEYTQAGSHSVKWDATDKPSGLYFCTLKASGLSETRKMLFLK
ncbi:LamG-like jellyroll fold domain-containing protein [Candidatus Latescibacterota bacterium]